jgi:hypothetical protein
VLGDPETGTIIESPVSMPLKMNCGTPSSRFVLISKSNAQMVIENVVIPVAGPDGTFAGVILAFQDVVHRPNETENDFGKAANLYLNASLQASGGEYSKAESFFRRALILFEKSLGGDHPKVANVLNDMAELYRKMGRSEEAETMAGKAEKLRRGIVDPPAIHQNK